MRERHDLISYLHDETIYSVTLNTLISRACLRMHTLTHTLTHLLLMRERHYIILNSTVIPVSLTCTHPLIHRLCILTYIDYLSHSSFSSSLTHDVIPVLAASPAALSFPALQLGLVNKHTHKDTFTHSLPCTSLPSHLPAHRRHGNKNHTKIYLPTCLAKKRRKNCE